MLNQNKEIFTEMEEIELTITNKEKSKCPYNILTNNHKKKKKKKKKKI